MEGLPGKSICFNNKLWHNQRKGAVMTDFANNENKELVRIYKNLKNGTAVIGELVHAGEGRGIDLRLDLAKKACRFMRNTIRKTKLRVPVFRILSASKKTSAAKNHVNRISPLFCFYRRL